MVEKIVEIIEDITEAFKEKEYVCYYCDSDNFGILKEIYLTKKELIKFINNHQLADIKIYKIKDRIKVKRELKIEEDK